MDKILLFHSEAKQKIKALTFQHYPTGRCHIVRFNAVSVGFYITGSSDHPRFLFKNTDYPCNKVLTLSHRNELCSIF